MTGLTHYFPPFLPFFAMVIVVLQRRPATRLRRRGAVSPETALPLEEMSAGDRRRFDRLLTEGVIKEGAPGRYYYDKEAVDAKVRARMPILIVAVVILLVTAVGIGWWTSTHSGPRTPVPAPASSGAAS